MDAEAAVTALGTTRSHPQGDVRQRMAAAKTGRNGCRRRPHSHMHVSASAGMMVQTCADPQ